MVLLAVTAVAAVLPLLQPASATVVQLVDSNYTSYFKDDLDPAAKVAMEYYAGWCPHCKHFAPTYDRIGSHFMDRDSPEVIVARIDCASNVRFMYNVPPC